MRQNAHRPGRTPTSQPNPSWQLRILQSSVAGEPCVCLLHVLRCRLPEGQSTTQKTSLPTQSLKLNNEKQTYERTRRRELLFSQSNERTTVCLSHHLGLVPLPVKSSLVMSCVEKRS